jgi:phosphinothricin acetyltransferase
VNGSGLDRSHARRLFGHTHRDDANLGELQRASRNPISKGLDQADRFALDDLLGDRTQQPVVDRILHAIGASWHAQIGFNLDVHFEVLSALSFGRTYSVASAECHALQNNPVHLAIVAWTGAPHPGQATGNNRRGEDMEPDLPSVTHPQVLVRLAVESDLEPLNEMYNQYVKDTHFTFDIEPMTMAVLGGAIVGYASSSQWRTKPAYLASIETSVYLAPEAVGRGAGTKLYEELFQSLDGEDVHRAYAGIALPNPASVALHEHFGFKRVGHFTEQGRKFDRYWDVAWFEKPLGGQAEG